MYIQETNVSFPALDATDIRAVQIASMCEFLLRKSESLAILTNAVAKLNLLSIL